MIIEKRETNTTTRENNQERRDIKEITNLNKVGYFNLSKLAETPLNMKVLQCVEMFLRGGGVGKIRTKTTILKKNLVNSLIFKAK